MTQHPRSTPAPTKPASTLQAALHLGGAAIGAQLYATYVLTNTIADASAKGLYDADTCQLLLAEQRALLRAVRVAGRGLAARTALGAAERQFLAEAEAALDQLTELIGRVETLASTPDDPNAQSEFATLRVDALERIRQILAPGAG
jgi:hypothetical protein